MLLAGKSDTTWFFCDSTVRNGCIISVLVFPRLTFNLSYLPVSHFTALVLLSPVCWGGQPEEVTGGTFCRDGQIEGPGSIGSWQSFTILLSLSLLLLPPSWSICQLQHHGLAVLTLEIKCCHNFYLVLQKCLVVPLALQEQKMTFKCYPLSFLILRMGQPAQYVTDIGLASMWIKYPALTLYLCHSIQLLIRICNILSRCHCLSSSISIKPKIVSC